MTTSYAPPAGVRIAGTGMAVPPRKVSNDDLAKFVDTSDEWIRPRTGIVTRHLSDETQLTSDLAAEATTQALKNAGLKPTDLDLLVVSTMTPDVICPATACRVVSKIGAIPCGAMDLNLACTGLVAGLSIANNFIMSGAYKHVAVIGADRLSTIVNWEDRKTCVLFGDAAGAMVLSASDNPSQQCLHQKLNSDGDMGEVLYVPRTESDIPERGKESFNGKFNTLQMNGREVYKFAVNALQECVREALEHTGLSADDIKMVIPHQSNIRMLQSAWKKMGFPTDKIYINIDRFGNTSAASIGLCMHELTEQGKLEQGDYVIFVAQGGGLTWGASLWRL